MTSKDRSFFVRARLALTVVASLAGAVLVTGCGIGGSLNASNGTSSAASFMGKLYGGPNPIQNATVKLYVTGDASGNNTGYGGGHFVQEANQVGASSGQDTGADGSFNFAGGYTCPAGQFLYVVSTAGNTGAGDNPKATLVAALGRCEDLFSAGTYTGGFIYLNEVTTVAAAYALGNFSTVTGTGAATQVLIGAPAANNAAVGCVADGSTCPTTAAAGLRHAFENAATLVNPFQPVGGNSSANGNPLVRVPLQLLNSIANSLVACVNSNGTNAACSTIFAATGTDTSTGNIFQVAVNLAKNPTLAGTGRTTSQFLHAATPQTNFYQPSLTAAPVDYSVSVTYARGLGAASGIQGFSYPYSAALDINDNIYIGNYDSASKTKFNAVSLTSNGTLVSITRDNSTNPTGTGASTDALGHLYLLGFSPRGVDATIARFTVDAATGTINSTPQVFFEGTDHPSAAAVDRQNNLWYGTQVNPTLVEIPVGTINTGTKLALDTPVTAVAIDPNQNIWVTSSSSDASVNTVGVLPNLTPVVPTYSTSDFVTATLPEAGPSGLSFVDNGLGAYTGYVANSGTTPGLTPVNPTPSGLLVTSITVGTPVAAGTAPVASATDGSGTVWAADGGDLVKYVPGGSPVVINPCHFQTTTTNTTCTTIDYAGVRTVNIDSTGSIWFLSADSAAASQVIGAAAPTWPLLSLGQFTEPQ